MLIHFPPQLSKLQEAVFSRLIDDWCVANGLVMRTGEGGSAIHAPVTMFPSPFSKSGFDEALRIQTAFNELYKAVAQRPEWILGVLESLVVHDDFTRRLVQAHKAATKTRRTQRLTGGLFRSDYMVNRVRTSDEGRQIKQVEFNTISVSFGGLSTRVTELHRFLADTNRGGTLLHGEIPRSPSLEKLAAGLAAMHAAYIYAEIKSGERRPSQTETETIMVNHPPRSPADDSAIATDGSDDEIEIPDDVPNVVSPPAAGDDIEDRDRTPNPESVAAGDPTPRAGSPAGNVPSSSSSISSAAAAAAAVTAGESVPCSDDDGCESPATAILVIVQPGETNIADQRLVEFELFNKHHVVAYRITLADVESRLQLTANNRLIFLPTGNEISVVYYRSGYSPNDYPTEKEWAARELLERSHAINCPSIMTQLSGSKKIQQLLTERDLLARFVPHFGDAAIDKLMRTFTPIYPLDSSPWGLEGRELAFASPERFVLKPQREGGGNNIYRDDIPAFLESIPKESWEAYILMELIEPPKISNKILRKSSTVYGRVVNELGVFGTILWDRETGDSLHNEQAGWLLRTKLQQSDEGGIAAGFGCLDSVLLNARNNH